MGNYLPDLPKDGESESCGGEYHRNIREKRFTQPSSLQAHSSMYGHAGGILSEHPIFDSALVESNLRRHRRYKATYVTSIKYRPTPEFENPWAVSEANLDSSANPFRPPGFSNSPHRLLLNPNDPGYMPFDLIPSALSEKSNPMNAHRISPLDSFESDKLASEFLARSKPASQNTRLGRSQGDFVPYPVPAAQKRETEMASGSIRKRRTTEITDLKKPLPTQERQIGNGYTEPRPSSDDKFTHTALTKGQSKIFVTATISQDCTGENQSDLLIALRDRKRCFKDRTTQGLSRNEKRRKLW
jgi:hypothetical protein